MPAAGRIAAAAVLAVLVMLPRAVDSADHRVIVSTGIPDHAYGPFPARGNPNSVRQQDYRFRIPMAPRDADRAAPLPMGPVAVALNGIPFYNPYNAEGRNAVEGAYAEMFDACNGHPDPGGRYHYHQSPRCLLQQRPELEKGGVVGWAFDGYEIRGPLEADGSRPAGLDSCNGHRGPEGAYHYHLTASFPYVMGCYHGVVARENFDGPGRGGPGGGPGMGPPGRRPPPGIAPPGLPPERRAALDDDLSNPPICRSPAPAG
ncbi:MAG: YHYH protein [Ferrovibrio sp.]